MWIDHSDEGSGDAVVLIHGGASNDCPHWTFAQVPEGGRMAPLHSPDLLNPVIVGFLKQ